MRFLFFLMMVVVPLWAQETKGVAAAIEGVTKPSADVSLSFTVATLVDELKVVEGQVVKSGDTLATQVKTAEMHQLERLKQESQSNVMVDRARAEKEYSEKDLQALKTMSKNARSLKEVTDAELKVKVAEFNLEKAKFEQQLAALKFRELESKLEQYKLKSPVEGVVEKLSIEPGEAPKAGEEHIRIVRVKPMWVEVPVPRRTAMKLRQRDGAQVVFPDGTFEPGARIIFISPVADTASDTVRVKLELANEKGRLVGERVKVVFEVAE